MATNGNVLPGSLAAALQATEIGKLLAGEREALAAGREVLFDARTHSLTVSRLVRNPACRFSHERWTLGFALGVTLRDALGVGRSASRLFVPDSAFVSKLVCTGCDFAQELWRLRESVDERLLRCPRCNVRRSVRGFDLVERISAECVPAPLLDHALEDRGLRERDVFGVEGEGCAARYFALGPEAKVPAGTLVVAGLGNIGSFLAPLVARIPAVSHVILCDPDVYEAHQVEGQDIAPSAVGRSKAEVQAERLRTIRPGLAVEAFPAPVEELPIGRLAGAVVVSCLDSRASRLRLAARAWRVWSPFVDAAVGGGPSLLVRTSVYLPEPGAACFECAFDASDYAALEQVLPCAGAESAAPR